MRCNKKNLEAIAETALVYYSNNAHKASLCDLTVQCERKKILPANLLCCNVCIKYLYYYHFLSCKLTDFGVAGF